LDITQGTAIENAIDLVVDLSSKEEKQKQRAIVVITDGENHEPAAVDAAQTALGVGISTFLVGAGTEAGAPIPVTERGRKQYKLDKGGQVVQSKMNAKLLAEIAKAGGGDLLDITNSDQSIARIKSKLSKLEKSEFEQQDFDVFETYYQYFVIVAILLLIAEFMIGYRRNKWLN
jgi:Ca-activated chloride channel family protein